MGYVYVIRNKVNNKRYVGQTLHTPKWRWSRHRTEAKNPKNHMPLSSAILKYGHESFEIEQEIKCLSQCELNKTEQRLIMELRTQDSAYGYNVRDGGRTFTDEDRQRLSQLMREKYNTPDAKARISAHRKQYFSNPESRQLAAETTKQQMTPVMRKRIAKGVERYWDSLPENERQARRISLFERAYKSKQNRYKGWVVDIVDPTGVKTTIAQVDFWQYAQTLGFNPTSATWSLRHGKPHKGYQFILRQDNASV